MLDNNFIKKIEMDKLKKILNFAKCSLSGDLTKKTLLIIAVLLMYKILGIIGLVISVFIAMGMDTCQTTSLKDVFIFFKGTFFPIMIIGVMLVGCTVSKTVKNDVYSISRMTILSKDTITSKAYREMVAKSELPSLTKFAKTYLRNTEENKNNAYYVYYDSISSKLFNVKEIINNRDTTYIVEKKLFKK
jgi:hypothetical protein